ncbi:MAG: peptide/nickel transport system substrate-binding protein [Microbacteriaceae bacterium]|nr:peptide/nickel transport system substrate-binding protein [Microbacteriaceae bacterium]
MSDDPGIAGLAEGLTRRHVIRGAMGAGFALTSGGLLAACGGSSPNANDKREVIAKLRRGGILRVGATGGGASDTIDAHTPRGDPDIMRVWNLYEPLAVRTPDFGKLEMLVAESIEAEKTPDSWVVRIRPGITFHNGKEVTADDVIFSLRRIADPKDPKVGAASIGYVDFKNLKKLDARTVRVPLEFANTNFPEDVSQYFNTIVPVDYDPKSPVGTGAFKFKSFKAGEQSVFTRYDGYWQNDRPYVDEVVMIDFPDDTSRTNALIGGQIEALTNLPSGQIESIKANSSLRVLISETGSWQPFCMRVDVSPFNDVRVREALRLVVDRKQMVQQVLNGQGRIANDLYAPFDPAYADDLPQREQDFEKAKALLKQAGREGLTIELTTAAMFRGAIEGAEVFAEQAKGAGVKVKLRKVDTGTYVGENFTKWHFAQDWWATRNYLTQVAQTDLPESPYNETHWEDPKYVKLIREARAELDEGKRKEILHAAQVMQYEQGGYIVPYFSNLTDAHSAKVGGFVKAKSGFPLGNYWFKNVGFLA